jgi:hypothetical protein
MDHKIKKSLSPKVFVSEMIVKLMYFHRENFSCQKLRMHSRQDTSN